MKAELIITKAKTQIMIDSVFYTTLMLGLKHEVTSKVKTAAVDGVTIFYNPSFVSRLSINECVGLIMHEIGHVAFQHINRKGNRHHKRWNIAGDYVINNGLVEQGFEIPCGGLLNDEYVGMSSDEVYKLIPESECEGYDPDIIEPTGAEDATTVNQQIIELVAKAKTQSELLDPGAIIDSEITRTLIELLNPKLDWNIVLQNFMQDYAKEDYSYSKPNRRYYPQYYLPSRHSASIKSVTVAIDTSGSVSQEEISEYLTEIQSIRETFDIEELTILACDFKLRNVIRVDPSENILDLKIDGGTYTATKPVLDYCNKHNPNVLIYFTDLEVNDIPEDEQSFSIIWINTYDETIAPIGRTICCN